MGVTRTPVGSRDPEPPSPSRPRSPGSRATSTTSSRRAWQDSRHVDARELEQGLLPIPEPVHHITGGTEGISMRHRKKASLQSLRETCWLYEKKCAGRYDARSLCARYVHALSRDVQQQLPDLAARLEKDAERVRYLETCMREWDETFGPVRSLDPAFDAEAEQARKPGGVRVLRDHLAAPAHGPAMTGLARQKLDALQVMSPLRLKRLLDEYVGTIADLHGRLRKHEAAAAAARARLEDEHKDEGLMLRAQCQAEVEHVKATMTAARSSLRQRYEAELEELRTDARRRSESVVTGYSRSKELEARIKKAGKELARVEAARARMGKELVRQKALADNKWAGLMQQARNEVHAKHRAAAGFLERRVENLQAQAREDKVFAEQRLQRYKVAVVQPLEAKVATLGKRAADVEAENAYLRNRTKELNKMLAAFQSAIALQTLQTPQSI